jgi:hypothetical protein
MLELRPGCERCDRDLPADSAEARICSFECTFCADCAERELGGICPNCRGELVARPRRPVEKLAKYPASTRRVHKPRAGGSAGASAPRERPEAVAADGARATQTRRHGKPYLMGR